MRKQYLFLILVVMCVTILLAACAPEQISDILALAAANLVWSG